MWRAAEDGVQETASNRLHARHLERIVHQLQVTFPSVLSCTDLQKRDSTPRGIERKGGKAARGREGRGSVAPAPVSRLGCLRFVTGLLSFTLPPPPEGPTLQSCEEDEAARRGSG
jgi:hypothetical protein